MNITIRTKLHTAISCVLGTAALWALSISAQAADPDVPTKKVRFTDLNIQTPEGAKVLYSRIRVAAREVCERSIGNDPILIGATRGCVDTAIDDAVKKVNAPYLTELRFGRGPAVRVASK